MKNSRICYFKGYLLLNLQIMVSMRELPNWTYIYRTKIRITNKTAVNLICIKYTWWNFDCNLYCFILWKIYKQIFFKSWYLLDQNLFDIIMYVTLSCVYYIKQLKNINFDSWIYTEVCKTITLGTHSSKTVHRI